MKALVIDASALIDLLPRSELAEHIHTQYDVAAPALVQWETGHVIHTAPRVFGDLARRKKIVATLLSPLRLIDQRARSGPIADLVETHGLSFYDAAYLQLAIDEAAVLLTEDRKLLAAATKVLGSDRAWTLDAAAEAVRAGLS